MAQILLNGININDFIITADEAKIPAAVTAAGILAKYLSETTGYAKAKGKGKYKIIIGRDADNEYGLGFDGVAIELKGAELKLSGQNARAVYYAVYEFLDKYLGWRFYAYGDEQRLDTGDIALNDFKYVHTPPFEYRLNMTAGAFGEDIVLKHKGNAVMGGRLPKEAGGSLNFAGLIQGHSYFTFVPPDEFFERHPEYFSMDENGERINNGQLCLTNPDVYRITEERLLKVLDGEPDADFISFGQMDTNKWCRCPECSKEYRKYGAYTGQKNLPLVLKHEEHGSPQGTQLPFVNKLARAVAKKHPRIKIKTFAYQYTGSPPVGIKVEKNVIIDVAHINECREHSAVDASCRDNPVFLKEISGWRKLTDNIYTWIYLTNFSNFPLQLPLIRTFYDDIKLYKRIGVKGVLALNNYCSADGGFADLFGYLISRWLWLGDMTYLEYYGCINEFLETHCGEGAPYMLEYLHLSASRPQSFQHFNPYSTAEHLIPLCLDESGAPDLSYINAARELFDKALSSVSDKKYKQNIERYRISIDFYAQEALNKYKKGDARYAEDNRKLYKAIKKAGIISLREGYRIKEEKDIDFTMCPSDSFNDK